MSLNVLPVTVRAGVPSQASEFVELFQMPPPTLVAVLPLMVLSVTVSVTNELPLSIPPPELPSRTELPSTMTLSKVAVTLSAQQLSL